MRTGTAGRHVGAECHRGTAADVIPSAEEIGERGFVEALDEDDVRMVLDTYVSGIERRNSAGWRRWGQVRDANGHAGRRRVIPCRIAGDRGERMIAIARRYAV